MGLEGLLSRLGHTPSPRRSLSQVIPWTLGPEPAQPSLDHITPCLSYSLSLVFLLPSVGFQHAILQPISL